MSSILMDRCAPELWAEIFALACTDNGYTGRALSLVSRYVRDCSRNVKLQSLSIHGLDQLEAFIDVLESKPPYERQVRNLFFTDRDLHTKSSRRAHVTLLLNDDDDEGTKYCATIDDLFTRTLVLVSSTLQTLTISCEVYIRGTVPLLPVDLPVLLELTIHGRCVPATFSRSCSAPRLKCLHLASLNVLPAPFSFQITRISPQLTHLRISGLFGWSGETGGLMEDLKALVDDRFNAQTELGAPDYVGVWPPTIQRVIISRGTIDLFGEVSTTYNDFGRRLERLAEEDSRGRLVVIPPPLVVYGEYNWIRDFESEGMFLRREWLQRMEGKAGCWDDL